MRKLLRTVFSDNTGATAIEYGLLVAIIALAITLSLGNLSTSVQDTLGKSETAMNTGSAP